MMNSWKRFRSPRDIVWGRGSFSYLESIPGKRALIVTDKIMTKLGVTDRAKAYLRKGGIESQVFDNVEPEPSIGTIRKILEENRDFTPDIIVGVGGGSSIDASKAFRIFFEHPQLRFEDIRYLGAPPKTSIPPFRKTLHVAIASTSGTGSDVSHACIITDPLIPAKCPISNQELIPEIAIVDPDLADTMPSTVVADAGLDALTHAIESYVNTLSNDFSRGYSLQAITLIMKFLPSAFAEKDAVSREHVHYGATIAGIAFSNSSNGICHTISNKVGVAFKLSHGRANAIALPYTIKFNSSIVGDLFLTIARAVGYNGKERDGGVNYLVERIDKIRRHLSVPGSYREAGIPQDAYQSKVKKFAEEAYTFRPTLSNPRRPSIEELETLFTACYEGDYTRL